MSLRIVVLGMMGRSPFAGQTWLYVNWLSGLRKGGHDVWYVEDDNVWLYDPAQNTVTDECTYAVRHIQDSLERVGMTDRWAFRFRDDASRTWGMSGRDIDELYRSCDVLLNIVGATVLRDEHLAAPFRVYVETDPVIAELQLATGDERTSTQFALYDAIATYGENYGAPDCGVPLSGRSFVTTRQPIDLDLWPARRDPNAEHFTTIGNYRQEGFDVEYDGQLYRWSKHHEWERVISLPSRTSQTFQVCLKIDDPHDQRRLEEHGWLVVPAFEMSLDVFGAYPEYIRGSRGEFTVAKDQNVRLRSGWFSERDACYLASAKPVVAQDTGFSNVLPTGEGLFAFADVDEAVAAIEAINGDYQRHATAARAIAESHFEAGTVAQRLLDDLGLT